MPNLFMWDKFSRGVNSISITAKLLGGGNPFASLMSTLLSGSSQLIAHPLEYGSMFQDRAGSIPVTEPGQLVGMVLDHGFTGSKPVLGPELVTNGGFDTDTDWVKGAGVSITGGVLVFSGSAGNTNQSAVATPVKGKFVRVSYEVTSLTTGTIQIYFQQTSPTVITTFGVRTSSLGVKTGIVFVPENARAFGFNTNNFVGTIDNVSVRELPGYHATAISDAARGVFREVDGIRYIEYNGVNTAYSTPALPAPLVDKAQVFAGVRRLVAATEIILELRGGNGTFTLAGFGSQHYLQSKGTLSTLILGPSIPTPVTNVLTGLGDIFGDIATLRIDGTQVAQSTADQGTGDYNPSGTYPLYYGARDGTSQFFNGRHYATLGPITRFSAANATAEQIEAAEAYYTARVI